MSPELIKAVAELAWPVLAAAILLGLLPTIARVLRSRGVVIKYGSMELSVQDASDQLRKQIEDLQDQLNLLATQGLVKNKNEATSKHAGSRGSRGRNDVPFSLLWVDDKPSNNAFEIAKLQDDGIDISTSSSTQSAIALLQEGMTKPDLIVSDMGRQEGLGYKRTAGLELIRSVRAQGSDVPVFVYTSGEAASRYAEEVKATGGAGITASPLELFHFIAVARIGRSGPASQDDRSGGPARRW